MLTVSYMPGCTLKTTGRNYEDSMLRLLYKLNVKVEELKNWFCCGTTYSMASDNLMNQLAPIRTLLRAKQTGRRELLVLCGHTHGSGETQILDNLHVLTGGAKYGEPAIQRVFEFE